MQMTCLIYKVPTWYAHYLIDNHTSFIDMQIILLTFIGLDWYAFDLIIMQITLV